MEVKSLLCSVQRKGNDCLLSMGGFEGMVTRGDNSDLTRGAAGSRAGGSGSCGYSGSFLAQPDDNRIFKSTCN